MQGRCIEPCECVEQKTTFGPQSEAQGRNRKTIDSSPPTSSRFETQMRKTVNQHQSLVAPTFTIGGGGSPRNITPSFLPATTKTNSKLWYPAQFGSATVNPPLVLWSQTSATIYHRLQLGTITPFRLDSRWLMQNYCDAATESRLRPPSCAAVRCCLNSVLLNLDYRRFIEMVVYEILQNSIQSRGRPRLNWETPLLIESQVCLELDRVYFVFWLFFSCCPRCFAIFHFCEF